MKRQDRIKKGLNIAYWIIVALSIIALLNGSSKITGLLIFSIGFIILLAIHRLLKIPFRL